MVYLFLVTMEVPIVAHHEENQDMVVVIII